MSSIQPRDLRHGANVRPEASVFIEGAKTMRYNPGTVGHFVGGARLPASAALQALGAKVQHVRGDGACWARATWQCVLSQVLDDDQTFNTFVSKVAESNSQIPEKLSRETIHILYKLKDLDAERRIEYLNHTEVDNSLVFYMRHVAADHMQKTGFGLMRPHEISEIKTDKYRYGGPEVVAFIRHFGLETHYITKNHKNEPIYQLTKAGQGREEINLATANREKLPLNKHCIFASSNAHYEYITFEHEVAMSPALAEQIDKDWDLAIGLQAEELQIRDQEESDHAVAMRLAQEQDNEPTPATTEPSETATTSTTTSVEPAAEPSVEPAQAKSAPEQKSRTLKERIINSLKDYQTFKKEHPIRAFFAKFIGHTFKSDNKRYVLTFAKKREIKAILKTEKKFVWYKPLPSQIRKLFTST